MISKSGKYALRAVLCLQVNSDENHKLSPSAIAAKIDIPVPYLAVILKQLSKHGVISSTKGRNGGFYLTPENAENPLISIIEIIDGLEKFTTCMMGLPKCSDNNPCPIHHLFVPLRNEVLSELRERSIKDFAQGVEDGETRLF